MKLAKWLSAISISFQPSRSEEVVGRISETLQFGKKQLLLSHDLGLVSESDHQVLASQATEVKRMLTSLLQKLKADS